MIVVDIFVCKYVRSYVNLIKANCFLVVNSLLTDPIV